LKKTEINTLWKVFAEDRLSDERLKSARVKTRLVNWYRVLHHKADSKALCNICLLNHLSVHTQTTPITSSIHITR